MIRSNAPLLNIKAKEFVHCGFSGISRRLPYIHCRATGKQARRPAILYMETPEKEGARWRRFFISKAGCAGALPAACAWRCCWERWDGFPACISASWRIRPGKWRLLTSRWTLPWSFPTSRAPRPMTWGSSITYWTASSPTAMYTRAWSRRWPFPPMCGMCGQRPRCFTGPKRRSGWWASPVRRLPRS